MQQTHYGMQPSIKFKKKFFYTIGVPVTIDSIAVSINNANSRSFILAAGIKGLNSLIDNLLIL